MNWTGLFAFLFLTILTGIGVFAALSPRQKSLVLGLADLCTAALIGTAIAGHLSIILIELGCFTSGWLLVSLAAASCGAGLIAVKKHFTGVSFRIDLSWQHLLLVAVVAAAAWVRLPPSHYLSGGQDQGIYVNLGHHLAAHGTLEILDPLMEKVSGSSSLRNEYLYRNYYGLSAAELTQDFEGYFIPGVYVSDLDKGLLVPQLYHLHSAWLAIAQWYFGWDLSTLPVMLFGLAGIIAAYAVARCLSRQALPALIAAALIAVNPFHTYFSRFPLAEISAAFFFLSGIACALPGLNKHRAHLLAACLCFSCVFFSRITGLLLLPPLFVFVAVRLGLAPRSRKSIDYMWFLAATLLFYIWSYYHGLALSFPYCLLSYRAFLGIDITDALQRHAVPAGAALVFLGTLVMLPAARGLLQQAWQRLKKNRGKAAAAALVVLLAASLARGAALAYGYAEAPHLEKWHLPGGGLQTLSRLNLVVLARMLGLPAALFCLAGTFLTFKRAFNSPRCLLFALMFGCFLTAFLVLRRVTPFLFYYSRYLSGELLPLAVIAVSLAAGSAALWAAKYRRQAAASIIIPLLLALPVAPHTWNVSKHKELAGFAERLALLDESIPQDAVLFVHESYFPSVFTIMPLRLSFQRRTFRFKLTDHFNEDALKEAMSLFADQGGTPYLATTRQRFKNKPYLRFKKKIVLPYRLMEQSNFSIPKKYTKRYFNIYLYEYARPNIIPH